MRNLFSNFIQVLRASHLLVVTVAVSLMSFWQTSTIAGNSSMLSDKPYFTLRLEMSACKYIVYMNGIIVDRDVSAMPVNVDLPVNHYMRTGKNDISVRLYGPGNGQPIAENTQCSVTLQVKQSGTNQTPSRISTISYVAHLEEQGKAITNSTREGRYSSSDQFKANKQGDVYVSDIIVEAIPNSTGKSLTQTVSVATPFPEWAFFSSDTLGLMQSIPRDQAIAMYNELGQFYVKLNQALKNNQLDKVMPLFEERSREIDQAFYYPPGTTQRQLQGKLTDSLSKSNLQLLDLSLDNLRFDLDMNNEKLLRLERADHHPAIVFNFTDTDANESYDLIFRREKGRWIIAR